MINIRRKTEKRRKQKNFKTQARGGIDYFQSHSQVRYFGSKLNNKNQKFQPKKKKKILMKQFRTKENYITILNLESNILKQAYAIIKRK